MNMKNKSRTIVVTSSAGFLSKTGALEMLVSQWATSVEWEGRELSGRSGRSGTVGKVRELEVAEEREGTVFPKVLEATRNSQPFSTLHGVLQ